MRAKATSLSPDDFLPPPDKRAAGEVMAKALNAPDQVAESIVKIDKAMKVLMDSRLKMDTIVTLVALSSKVGKRDVYNVLMAASTLAETYLKPEDV